MATNDAVIIGDSMLSSIDQDYFEYYNTEAGTSYTLTNYAVGGTATDQAYNGYAEGGQESLSAILTAKNPGLVMIHAGTNDPFDVFTTAYWYRKIIDDCLAAGVTKIILCGRPPINNTTSTLAKRQNAENIRLCVEKGVEYSNNYEAMLDLSDLSDEVILAAYTGDGTHYSVNGQVLAMRIAGHAAIPTALDLPAGYTDSGYYDWGRWTQWSKTGCTEESGNLVATASDDTAISTIYNIGKWKKQITLPAVANSTEYYRLSTATFVRDSAAGWTEYTVPIENNADCFIQFKIVFSAAQTVTTFTVAVDDQKYPAVVSPSEWYKE